MCLTRPVGWHSDDYGGFVMGKCKNCKHWKNSWAGQGSYTGYMYGNCHELICGDLVDVGFQEDNTETREDFCCIKFILKDECTMSDEKWPEPIKPKNQKLTVIIRDVSPLTVLQEPVTHRTVSIELTEAQLEQLKLKCTGMNYGEPIYEDISRCFFENASTEPV